MYKLNERENYNSLFYGVFLKSFNKFKEILKKITSIIFIKSRKLNTGIHLKFEIQTEKM